MLPPWQDSLAREESIDAALDAVRSARDMLADLDARLRSAEGRDVPLEEQLDHLALVQRFFELAIRNALLDPAAIPVAAIAHAGRCDEAFVEHLGSSVALR